ncbi:helix-turn-helix domain-containing protein [Fructobacillus fructosus]|uniref:helix-turn-helix domain-containing protein n=1 Tax=Fructobacillus fructosus TaxID=1631 RepID=UPI001F4E9417|nr:helix-turn-helix transcriptional regulator [Fructobacillus fructosus]MCH9869658.1 helix-turn-helix transcriptional regulator [Serratia marcescens]MCK8638830.1 helix-turn-helix transcriptional regulator [Fructobacillus fructosus]
MSNRLKELRKENNCTLDDIAKKTGIKRGTYNNYKNGKTEPKLATWQKLADFFDVSVGYLQGISDIRKPFESHTMEEWWGKTLGYMADVNPQVFDEEHKKHEQIKATKQVAPILDVISKNESLPDNYIDYNVEIKDDTTKANIYKATSMLADLGRNSSPEAKADLQRITELLEHLEERTQIPPELGGYE